MTAEKISLTDLKLNDDEIVEIELSRSPWGQQVLHVSIGAVCVLRVANGKMSLRDTRNPEPSAISVQPSNTQSLEDIIQHIRFGRVHDVAVLSMTHQVMGKIRTLVDKHFPQNPPLHISYSEGGVSTACLITVGAKEHLIAFLFSPNPTI